MRELTHVTQSLRFQFTKTIRGSLTKPMCSSLPSRFPCLPAPLVFLRTAHQTSYQHTSPHSGTVCGETVPNALLVPPATLRDVSFAATTLLCNRPSLLTAQRSSCRMVGMSKHLQFFLSFDV